MRSARSKAACRPSTRLDEIGAALEDGLGLVRGDLVLPPLGALADILGALLGLVLRSGGFQRDPGVFALLAQLYRYREPPVRLDPGEAYLARRRCRRRRLAHVVELDVADRSDDSIDTGALL